MRTARILIARLRTRNLSRQKTRGSPAKRAKLRRPAKNSEINYRARFNSLAAINRTRTYNSQRNSTATNGGSWTRRSIPQQVCTFHVTGVNQIAVNNDRGA
jgi:hypothetical protein